MSNNATRLRWTGVEASLQLLSQGSTNIAVTGVALFLPLIRRDLGLSFSEAGSLGAVALAVYALMQVPAGYLCDRYGPKRILVAGLVGTNALAVVFGLFGVYPVLVLVQGLSGIFRALTFTSGLLLIRSLFPPDRETTALGLVSSGQFLVVMLLNGVGPLLSGPLGWPLTFVVLGAAGFVALGAYLGVSRPETARPGGGTASLRQTVGFFQHSEVWLIGGIQFVRLAVATGFGFWLPTLIVIEKGYSLAVAGFIVALSALMTAPSGVIGGYLTDRLRSPLLVIATCQAILALTMIALVEARDVTPLIVIVIVHSLFRQAYFGPVFVLPIRLLGSVSAGRVTGVANLFANAGAFTATLVIGLLKDLTGSFSAGMELIATICVIGIGVTALLGRVEGLRASDKPAPITTSM